MKTARALMLLLLATAAPALADDRAKYLADMKQTLNATSYHEVLTAPMGPSMPPLVTQVDFVAPDRIESTNAYAALIAIGTKTWAKPAGANAWQPGPAGDIKQLNPMNLVAAISGDDTVTYVDAGAGTFAGKPARIEKFTLTHAGKTTGATLYFGNDGFLYHVESANADIPITLDFAQYNSSTISIEAPS